LPENWLNFIVIMIATAIACAGISVLIGVVSPNSRMTVLWSQIIFVPSMMLGGLMMPYSALPAIAGKFAQLLPATQAMNAFNGLAMGTTADFSPWGSVIILMTSGILAFGLAVYLFSWDNHNATRRGNPLLAWLVLVPYVIGIFL
jgi:ABC-2 type transport system permease protein